MTPEELTAKIRQHLPDAEVLTQDLTGTEDHWQVTVISTWFEGKRLLQQHRKVKDALSEALKNRTLHALTLKTYTPSRWAQHNASN